MGVARSHCAPTRARLSPRSSLAHRCTIAFASPHTALLFFSHRPVREGATKRFVPRDAAKSRDVAEALHRHTREAAHASGLPVLEISGSEQRGDTFGERFANAIAEAFAQGYEHIIAVGGDCPRLHEVDWQTVADRLAAGTPVLGPTGRGGAYLVGLSRASFEADAFAALPWQTPALFDALRHHLSARIGTPAVLRPRADVNGAADLRHLLRTARPSAPLVACLRAILGRSLHRVAVRSLAARVFIRHSRLRGPPAEGALVGTRR